MDILFWALTISTAGKILLAVGVLMAHWELAKERRVDDAVIRFIRIEYVVTFIGLLMIVAGYLLELQAFHVVDILQNL